MQLQKLTYEMTICKVADLSAVDFTLKYFFINKTDEEISLVCRTQDTPKDVIARDDGWRGIRVHGIPTLSSIGILAKIAGILASNMISLFSVSTYDSHYILMKSEQYETAIGVLEEHGYSVVD